MASNNSSMPIQFFANQMKIKNIFLSLVLLSVVACVKPDERFTVKPDVMFRLVAPESCGYCKSVDYAPGTEFTIKIKLGPVIVRPQDIEYVSRDTDSDTSIKFSYNEDSQLRILNATRDITGERIVLLSGDRVVAIFIVSEPFSKGSKINLSTSSELVIKQISNTPYP